MRKLTLLAMLAAGVWACGETETSDGRSGDGGTGGAAGTGGSGGFANVSADVEATCRDYCTAANECSYRTVRGSCAQYYTPSRGNPYCVVYNYRTEPFTGEPCLDDCLQQAAQVCGEHTVAKKGCELELDCNDEFNDCAGHDEAYNDCLTRAADRAYCADSCPDMDPNDCDRAKCEANLYCESACPTLDRTQCIDQRISEGQCEHHEAVSQCRQHCGQQDLIQCVSQWLADGRCEFDDGSAACDAYCPPDNGYHYVCVRHWDTYNQCPAFPELSTCTVLCIGECVIEGVDPSQGFDQCVTSCYDQQPYANDCTSQSNSLFFCLEASGCAAAQTATCGDQAAALSACLAGIGPPPAPTTCRALCSGDCAIDVPLSAVPGAQLATIDPGLGLESCVTSCEQQFPNRNDACVSVANNLNECLQMNGCAAQTTTCGTTADTVNLCLWGIFD